MKLALGVTSRAVEERVLFDDLSDADLLCMLKTGEGIAHITSIVEGEFLILRFELFQAFLQCLAFCVHLKIILFLGGLDFRLLAAFAGRFLLV